MTTCVWEPFGPTASGGFRYTRRHALEGSSARQQEDERSGQRTVHLHYNGCSHYSVFVPDAEVETEQPVPQPPAAAAPATAPASSKACAEGVAPPPAPLSTTLPQSRPSGVASVGRASAVGSAGAAARPGSHGRSASAVSHRAVKSARPHGSGVGSSQRAADDFARRAAHVHAVATARRASTPAGAAAAGRRPRVPPAAVVPRSQPLSASTASSRLHAAARHGTRRAATLSAHGKRPFSDLVAERVKLSFRLEPRAGLPPARPREVRV